MGPTFQRFFYMLLLISPFPQLVFALLKCEWEQYPGSNIRTYWFASTDDGGEGIDGIEKRLESFRDALEIKDYIAEDGKNFFINLQPGEPWQFKAKFQTLPKSGSPYMVERVAKAKLGEDCSCEQVVDRLNDEEREARKEEAEKAKIEEERRVREEERKARTKERKAKKKQQQSEQLETIVEEDEDTE